MRQRPTRVILPGVKLYTRHGDDGSTSLFGGQRVEKHALRVEAYGAIDELNSALGLAATAADGTLKPIIEQLQAELFQLGATVCTPPGKSVRHVAPVTGAHVAQLETTIDALTEGLAPMRHFILPGGSEAAARLHVARTVCRRAERRLVALAQHEAVDPPVLAYFNRLSDLLFAMARAANHRAGVADVPWKP